MTLRILIIVLSLALCAPVSAQNWGSYANARYGATADVPPGFLPAGPEATNSDGLIFRNRSGGLLTIYGAPVPGNDFAALIAKMMEHDRSYNGWPVVDTTVTPDWAEYGASHGGRNLRVRVEATCNGSIAIVAKFEYSGNMSREVTRVHNSLEAGPANSC